MKELLRDSRVRRLLVANTLGSIGSGITIFSVPWLLVHLPGGNEAFRWATIGTTLVLVVTTPYYGAWVDGHSRKTALLASELWGLTATLAMAAIGLASGGFGAPALMAVYFAGMLYYTLHFPAKFALVQQLFAPAQYRALTGLLEVQGQTALMIAGGLGGLLVERVPLWGILLFDASTYLVSFLLLRTLPYRATHLESSDRAAPSTASAWSRIREGWEWLRARPRLAVFFTCTLIPFVVVMSANYLFPIYVAQTLRAGAEYFAGGEITFALGAIAAGFLLPRLGGEHSAAASLPATMLVFLAGLLAVIFVPSPGTYLAAGVLLGFGNAGCRVARSALLLRLVPNAVMGRVGGFYQVLDRLLRTTLVLSLSLVDSRGAPAGFGLLTVVFLAAFAGLIATRSAAERAAA